MKEIKKPTEEQIKKACKEYRNDFDHVGPIEKEIIRSFALKWFKIWKKILE